MELVTSMWRQDRLRALELATLTTAAAERPPSEATVRKLGTYARYGARIDKDIGRALQALRILRNRPDAWIDELQNGTSEPSEPKPLEQECTNEWSPCTLEPGPTTAGVEPAAPELDPMQQASCTFEPERRLNRHQRRALAALQRRRAA